MDVAAALALVTAAAGGAATAAGGAAWESLMALARRVTGRAEPEPVDPADDAAVRELRARLRAHAARDAAFADDLRRWADEHRAVLTVSQSRTENVISGQAQVTNAVQADTINGNISFGR
ncbi:hypothetical protein [Streptomyces radicis]|uniref:hypothetical protein n=1 Tax=Streptomyces radicis TaxID=1750517 RepID=UPI0011C345C4|nr:hypothetical protein [Streptomyces radicis]